jgi:protein-tyrosine phosphatase
MNQCLFICTGNYYRSRYAEAVFNFHARQEHLKWKAFSRGLAIHLAKGDLASQTRSMLEEKGIPISMTGSTRVQLHEHDFHAAQKVIALQHHEHYPMMQSKFPHWADKIEYWDVADIEFVSARLALMRIEQLTLELLAGLKV